MGVGKKMWTNNAVTKETKELQCVCLRLQHANRNDIAQMGHEHGQGRTNNSSNLFLIHVDNALDPFCLLGQISYVRRTMEVKPFLR